jgi:hypothetical protein
MLFSAGAYTLGSGFDNTDFPSLAVNATFNHLGIGETTPFWVLFLLLTGVMIFSALIFQSKTMRTMIFIPLPWCGQSLCYDVISLALPVRS